MLLMGNRDDYQALVQKAGPAGYWPLRDNLQDWGPFARHGVEHGGPRFIEDATGGWLELDGQSFIEIASHPSFSQPTSGQGLSIAVWLRVHTLDFPSQYLHWLGKGEHDRQEWAFRLHSSSSDTPGKLSAYLWNPEGELGAGARFYDPGHPVICNHWMFLSASFQPGDAGNPEAGVELSVDGVLRQGPPASGTLYQSSRWSIYPQAGCAPVRLGTRNLLEHCLHGGLAEAAIFPRVLSPGEIGAFYQAGARVFAPEGSPRV